MTFREVVDADLIRDIAWTEVVGPGDEVLESLVRRLKEVMQTYDGGQRPDGRKRFYQAMIAAGSTVDVHRVVALYNDGVAEGSRERAKACILDSDPDVVIRFKNNEFPTIVVLRKLMEGFDHHPDVAFVVVARKMKILPFNEFVGQATRIDDGHVGVAQVISHQVFNQKPNFDNMRDGAWALPEEEEESLFSGAMTQQVLEDVAKDPTIVGCC